MEFVIDKLTKKQKTTLAKLGARLHKTAIKSSNNDMVQQAVATKYGYNWVFTYYRTVDNLINDSWSIGISAISTMVVDKFLSEYPEVSNVTPVYIQNGSEYFINSNFATEEGED